MLAAPSRAVHHGPVTNPVSRDREDEGASAREPWVLPLLPPLVGPCSPGEHRRRPAHVRAANLARLTIVRAVHVRAHDFAGLNKARAARVGAHDSRGLKS